MSVMIHNACIQLECSHDPDPVIEFGLLRLQAVTIPHGGRRDKPFLKGECKFEVFKVDLYNCNHHRSAEDSLCSEGLENSVWRQITMYGTVKRQLAWSAVARVITD
jgi:hypothetical protein